MVVKEALEKVKSPMIFDDYHKNLMISLNKKIQKRGWAVESIKDQGGKMKIKKKFILGAILMMFLFIGCGQQEIANLQSENELLKKKITSMEQEISKLKETADYHYKQGVDFLSANKYEEALTEFKTVIKKYPTSPLIANSKQQLVKALKDEKRRTEKKRLQEEKKYRPRTQIEAIKEWKKFRNNEGKYKGTITTWRMQVSNILNGNIFGWLGGFFSYRVAVIGPNAVATTYESAISFSDKFPRVKKEDWIVVTGEFRYVSSDSVVTLRPVRVKNEGYK